MRLLTADEFGARIGLSAQSIRAFAKEGKLPKPVQLGKCLRWRESDVNRFIAGDDAPGGAGLPVGPCGGPLDYQTRPLGEIQAR
jgi:predicted DNA-binding transcriptional regulator AlpA